MLPTITGIAGLLLGAAIVAGVHARQDWMAGREQSAVLAEAVEACGVADADGLTLADGGTTLTFDMQGEDELSDEGGDYLDIVCVFDQLEMPANVMSNISQTTAMDGRQTQTWNGVTISWSYHPDRGLDGVLSVGRE